jgi:hypothetical protein
MTTSVPSVRQEKDWIARYLIRCAHAHRRGDITPWQIFASLMLLKSLHWRLALLRMRLRLWR